MLAWNESATARMASVFVSWFAKCALTDATSQRITITSVSMRSILLCFCGVQLRNVKGAVHHASFTSGLGGRKVTSAILVLVSWWSESDRVGNAFVKIEGSVMNVFLIFKSLAFSGSFERVDIFMVAGNYEAVVMCNSCDGIRMLEINISNKVFFTIM